MNDWTPFQHNDPLVSDEQAHRFADAVQYRPGQWQAFCACGASMTMLESKTACEAWVLVHAEIERSLAITVPGYER